MRKKAITRKQLARAVMRDLVNAVRAARKYKFDKRVSKLETTIQTYFNVRHTEPFDQNGWPICIGEDR